MEAINNITAAAVKAVWGEPQVEQKPSTAEPVSGKTGDVSKGEPYDAGNIGEPQPSVEAQKTPTTEAPASVGTPVATTEAPAPQSVATPVVNSTTQPTEDPMHMSNPQGAQDPAAKPTATPAFQPADNFATKSAATSAPTTASNPAVTQPSSATPGDSTKAQNDPRAPDDPATHLEHPVTHAKQDVDDRGDAALQGILSPDKLNGPGPNPAAELAKEHGGDFGALDKKLTDKSLSAPDVAASGDAQVSESEGGKAPQQKGKDGEAPGTGEERVVRTTGLRADGGNFDAAAAGAGREADRLLAMKEAHHDVPGAKDDGHDSSDSIDRSSNGSSGPGEKKPKLLKRLKAKLPHHHKKHAV